MDVVLTSSFPAYSATITRSILTNGYSTKNVKGQHVVCSARISLITHASKKNNSDKISFSDQLLDYIEG